MEYPSLPSGTGAFRFSHYAQWGVRQYLEFDPPARNVYLLRRGEQLASRWVEVDHSDVLDLAALDIASATTSP